MPTNQNDAAKSGKGRDLSKLCLAAGLAVGSFFILWLFPVSKISTVLREGAYWVTFLLVLLLAVYTGRAVRANRRDLRDFFRDPFLLCLIPVAAWLMFIHADFGYKIVMDDYVLVATSQNFHLTRDFFVPVSGFWKGGGADFVFNDGYVDKRPWLYPFLVSLLHDLSGFRVANAFLLNAAMSLVLIGLTYALTKPIAGRSGGILAGLLLASIPLVGQNATGSGMDMTNATFLAFAMVSGGWYLRRPDEVRQGLFVLAALCLAYARYESVLYVVPAVLVAVLGWWRAKRVIVSLPALLSGPLLLGLLLQNRFFRKSEALWELHSGTEAPFGFHHVADNLARAVYFFFNLDGTLANAPLVSVVGLAGLLFFLLMVQRSLREREAMDPVLLSGTFFGLFIVVNFFVLMAYHDGKLDRLFASRLSLPFYLLLVLSPVWAFQQFFQNRAVFLASLGVVAVSCLGWTLPVSAKQVFTKRNFIRYELEWLIEDFAREIKRSDIVIDQFSTPWAIQRRTAIRPKVFVESLEWINSRLDSGRLSGLYLVERLEYSIRGGKPVLQESSFPEGIFDRTLVRERSFRPFTMVRVYRLSNLRPDRLDPDWADSLEPGKAQAYTFTGL